MVLLTFLNIIIFVLKYFDPLKVNSARHWAFLLLAFQSRHRPIQCFSIMLSKFQKKLP